MIIKNKALDYEITTDPKFRDEDFAMTEELRHEQNKIFERFSEDRIGRKTIDHLLKLIEKHPKNPQLKNYLSTAYERLGNKEKAHETNKWLMQEHPDYLFGKLNLAAKYHQDGLFGKMKEELGEHFDLKALYPSRNTFHLSEVTAMNRLAVMYFSSTGDLEEAEKRLELMNEIAPDHPDTRQALIYLFQARMKAGMKIFEEDEKTKIRVKPRQGVGAVQRKQKPNFTHEEINLLYEEGLHIGKENLDMILALPRETLIADLEKILQDLRLRYDYYKKLVDKQGFDDETMQFSIHAIYLLGELRAEESLAAVMEILREGEKFIDFWFGDFLIDNLWEPLYFIAGNRIEYLKQLAVEPGICTYVRTEIARVIQQIAFHQPERREEVLHWFRVVFQRYASCRVKDNIVDSDAIGLMIGDLMDIGAIELLPEIEKLYDLGYVSASVCGDWKDVEKAMYTEPVKEHKKALMSITDRYQHITTTWAGYKETEEDQESLYDDDEDDTPETTIKRAKTGRNDPCLCGSGKKYKKCCLKKDY